MDFLNSLILLLAEVIIFGLIVLVLIGIISVIKRFIEHLKD